MEYEVNYKYLNMEKVRNKEAFIKSRKNKCAICANSYPIECYDIHHIDGRDKKGVLFWYQDKETLKKELKTCVLLCSNCHRRYHFGPDREDLEELIMENFLKYNDTTPPNGVVSI